MSKTDLKNKMRNKRFKLGWIVILLLVFTSCEQTTPFNIGPQYDPEANLAKDRPKINEYLAKTPMDSLYRIHDPSGVIVIVQKEGSGSRPTNGSIVYTNYTGYLMETGAVFDTNIEIVARENNIFSETNKYVTFSFSMGSGGVIGGWEIGFRRMRPGTIAKIIIPSAWAYKDVANNPRIPANSILVFDVNFKGID
jgi:FKBP-type peptidyl-prolyl cis-trans isomerase FkpA